MSATIGKSLVTPNVEAIRELVGDVPPHFYGEAFDRWYYRVMNGQPVTLRKLDEFACLLGVHVRELMREAY
jgi:hypothetical protein